MSAAEKLKGLDTLTLKNEHNVPIRSLTVAEQLADALPQIVAVVELAENRNALRGDLDRALAALDETLS